MRVPEQYRVPVGAPREHPDDPPTSLRLRESELGSESRNPRGTMDDRARAEIGSEEAWARPGGARHQRRVSRESGRWAPARDACLALGQGVTGLRRICLELPREALGDWDCSPTPR